MSLTNTQKVELSRLNEQVRLSVTQGLLQVVGPENIIKILDGNVTADQLYPSGTHLTLRLSIDIYPKDPQK